MEKSRSNSGQGAILIFVIFIVIILMTVGVTLSLTQNKEIVRTVYEEQNLRTLNAAESGIEEAVGTRFIPRSNIASIQNSIATKSFMKYISSNYPEMVNNLPAKSGSPYFPNSGVLLANPNTTPMLSSVEDVSKEILGIYIYKVIGGKTETNKVSSVGKPIGKPSASISDRLIIYSLGMSMLPNGKVDKVGIIARVDIDRYDNDATGADEIESKEIIKDPAQIAARIEPILVPDIKSPAIERFVAYTYNKVNYDVATNEFKTEYYNQSPPMDTTSLPSGGATSGTYPNTFPTSSSPYLVTTNAQMRIFFNEPIDPMSINNGNIEISKYDDKGKLLGKYSSGSYYTNLPTSNAIAVMLPTASSMQLETNCNYEISVKNIKDFYGNVMYGPVKFRIRTK